MGGWTVADFIDKTHASTPKGFTDPCKNPSQTFASPRDRGTLLCIPLHSGVLPTIYPFFFHQWKRRYVQYNIRCLSNLVRVSKKVYNFWISGVSLPRWQWAHHVWSKSCAVAQHLVSNAIFFSLRGRFRNCGPWRYSLIRRAESTRAAHAVISPRLHCIRNFTPWKESPREPPTDSFFEKKNFEMTQFCFFGSDEPRNDWWVVENATVLQKRHLQFWLVLPIYPCDESCLPEQRSV